MTRARVWSAGALAVAIPMALLAGCKLIAGYQDVALGPADAAQEGDDAGEAGCLSPPLTKIFPLNNTLADLFVTNGVLYAVYTDTAAATAVAACNPSSCATPKVIVPPNTQLFSATATGATPSALYVAVSSLTVFEPDGGVGPDMTGAIDVVASDGGSAEGGSRAVAAGLAFPSYLSANGAAIYYADDPNNAIAVNGMALPPSRATLRKLPLTDGAAPTDWITGLGGTYQVAVGSSRVFVLSDTSAAAAASGIFACGLQAPCGGKPQVLVPTGADATYGSLAVDGDDLYFASTVGTSGTIVHVSPDGGTASVATAQDAPSNVVVDASHIYWMVTLMAPGGQQQLGEVRRVRKDGSGAVERVVCGLRMTPGAATVSSTSGTFLALDDGHIYVAESDVSGATTIIERTSKP